MEADEALKVSEELCGSYSASSIPKTFGAASGSLCLLKLGMGTFPNQNDAAWSKETMS